MKRVLMSMMAMGLAAGCASLEFRAATGEVPSGVRVRAPVSCVVVKEITRKSGLVQRVEELAVLPLGEAYDINVRQGWLSATEFSVTLGEQGTLKQVTLNADPQVDEALRSVADVLDSVPVLKAPRAEEDDPVVREAVVEVRRLTLKE